MEESKKRKASGKDEEEEDNDIIVLNVGGQRFETSRAQLTTKPNTLLGAWFSRDDWLGNKTRNGEFFIDQNPRRFQKILAFYRLGIIADVPPTEQKEWDAELEYYGIITSTEKNAMNESKKTNYTIYDTLRAPNFVTERRRLSEMENSRQDDIREIARIVFTTFQMNSQYTKAPTVIKQYWTVLHRSKYPMYNGMSLELFEVLISSGIAFMEAIEQQFGWTCTTWTSRTGVYNTATVDKNLDWPEGCLHSSDRQTRIERITRFNLIFKKLGKNAKLETPTNKEVT